MEDYKWYSNPKFSLIPKLEIKKKNEHNTSGFTFYWLLFKVWTLDCFSFEVSLVIDDHWGIGVIGILPYLRWTCCIPISTKMEIWIYRNLYRKSQNEKSKL